MSDVYSRVDLANLSASDPAPLPIEIDGLTDENLADLSAALDPVPDPFAGVGYWPATIIEPVVDPRVETFEDGFDLVLDAVARSVTATGRTRPLTPAEIAALPALTPRTLGKLEFIGLVQQVGGMTDAQLTAAYKDPALEAFWVKYQMASSVERDHPVTGQALAALDALAYIPLGAAAVIAAWPTA